MLGMILKWTGSSIVAGALALTPVALHGQSGKQQAPSVTASNTADSDRPSRQLLTSTVHQAWLMSDRNEDKFFDMVKQLAELSAHNRGVTLPDSEAAGRQMGMLIRTNARRDPDQLLYAVVDTAVRQTAKSIPAKK